MVGADLRAAPGGWDVDADGGAAVHDHDDDHVHDDDNDHVQDHVQVQVENGRWGWVGEVVRGP